MGTHTYEHSTLTVDGHDVQVTYTHFTPDGAICWDVYVDGELITDESEPTEPGVDRIRELIEEAAQR